MREIKVHPLFTKFPTETVNRILGQYYCELELDFPGFVDIYSSLSRIIPKHFTVIDFGCYLATQCWYFRKHKAYIGVDITDLERFSMPNTTHYAEDIYNWIRDHKDDFNRNQTFAICSYVGDRAMAATKYFTNCFCFYPSHENHNVLRNCDIESLNKHDSLLGNFEWMKTEKRHHFYNLNRELIK